MSRLWLLLLVVPALTGCGSTPDLTATPVQPISIAPPLPPPAGLKVSPPTQPVLPPVISRSLPNGLRLITIERPQSPLVRIDLVVNHGASDQLELPAITDRLLAYGPRGQSEQEFKTALDSLGARLNIITGLLTSRLSLTVQAGDLGPALQLLAPLVNSPALPEAFLRYEINQLKVQQRSQEASGAWLARTLFYQIAYPDHHPLRAAGALDRDSLDGLRHDKVLAYGKCAFRPGNLSLVVTGPVNPDSLQDQALALWHAQAGSDAGHQCDLPTRNLVASARVQPPSQESLRIHIVDRPHSAQVELRIGWPTVDRTHQDWLPLTMLAKLLDGASGRLFLDLRERQGLAYHITARQSEGLFASPFSVATASRPQHASAMLKGILAHLENLRTRQVVPADLVRVRQQIAGELNLLYEEDGRLANRVILTRLSGQEPEHTDQQYRQLGEISGRQLQETAERWFGTAPVVVLVGQRRQLVPQLKQVFPDAELIIYRVDFKTGKRRTGSP